MKLAAIDIGSNAVRLQITNAIEYDNTVTFKKLQYIRFPLRLGRDVFSTGIVSPKNEERFVKLMTTYKTMIDLYEVNHFYGCATSAMRESSNGRDIVKKVNDTIQLKINLINGQKEAQLINEAVKLGMENKKSYLHIDVGGGSTELNYYKKGIKIASSSFKTGSVRRLDGLEDPQVWNKITKWITQNIQSEKSIQAIGTGGNINKLFELTNEIDGRKTTIKKLKRVVKNVSKMSITERMLKLQMNEDRADVIIPASEIYITVMKLAKAKKILVPDVGLKDGINIMLFEKAKPNHGKMIVKNI